MGGSIPSEPIDGLAVLLQKRVHKAMTGFTLFNHCQRPPVGIPAGFQINQRAIALVSLHRKGKGRHRLSKKTLDY